MTVETALLVGVVAAALITAVVALSKRRPDVAKVYIEGAEALVVMHVQALKEANERMDRMEAQLRRLHEQVEQLSADRDRYQQELATAEGKVEALTHRVAVLEEQLRKHDIPVPPEH